MKYIYNKNIHSFLSGVAIVSTPLDSTYHAQLEWVSNVTHAMGFDTIECADSVFDFLVDVINYDLEDCLTILELVDPKVGIQLR